MDSKLFDTSSVSDWELRYSGSTEKVAESSMHFCRYDFPVGCRAMTGCELLRNVAGESIAMTVDQVTFLL